MRYNGIGREADMTLVIGIWIGFLLGAAVTRLIDNGTFD